LIPRVGLDELRVLTGPVPLCAPSLELLLYVSRYLIVLWVVLACDSTLPLAR